jgi:hypothetical protein
MVAVGQVVQAARLAQVVLQDKTGNLQAFINIKLKQRLLQGIRYLVMLYGIILLR